MPNYELVTVKDVKPLGNFSNLEAVSKLHIFKTYPNLLKNVREVAAVEKPFTSNRWRFIFTYIYIDLTGTYTEEEARAVAKDCFTAPRLRLVPKREYHESDGII